MSRISVRTKTMILHKFCSSALFSQSATSATRLIVLVWTWKLSAQVRRSLSSQCDSLLRTQHAIWRRLHAGAVITVTAPPLPPYRFYSIVQAARHCALVYNASLYRETPAHLHCSKLSFLVRVSQSMSCSHSSAFITRGLRPQQCRRKPEWGPSNNWPSVFWRPF